MEHETITAFFAFWRIAVVAMAALLASAQSQPPLKFLQDIPLPGVATGDFDHFAVDLAGNRLFLAGE